jgi:hypothetical protein
VLVDWDRFYNCLISLGRNRSRSRDVDHHAGENTSVE